MGRQVKMLAVGHLSETDTSKHPIKSKYCQAFLFISLNFGIWRIKILETFSQALEGVTVSFAVRATYI